MYQHYADNSYHVATDAVQVELKLEPEGITKSSFGAISTISQPIDCVARQQLSSRKLAGDT